MSRLLGTVDPARGLGRYALAAIVVVGPLTQVVALLARPWTAGDDYVRDFAARIDSYPVMGWLFLVGLCTLAPAAIGVGVLVMRRAPILGMVGLALTVPGLLNPDGNPDDIIFSGTRVGLGPDVIEKMFDQLAGLPAFGPFGFYAFVVGFSLGGVILGAGLLRGRTAPGWAAVSLIVAATAGLLGAFVNLGSAVPVVAWLLVTVAFTGCAIRIARVPNPVAAGRVAARADSDAVPPI